MTLSAEEMVAAAAARRLLDDPHFKAIFDKIVADAAEKSIFNDDAAAREANRQLVLAINRIRGELEANAEAPEADRAADQLAKAME